MATIKSFTDLQQSRKLAKILPLKSADMVHIVKRNDCREPWELAAEESVNVHTCLKDSASMCLSDYALPCWSLAALLSVLPRETRLLKSATDDIYYHCDCPKGNIDEWFDNPVDACVEMIKRLHELNLL